MNNYIHKIKNLMSTAEIRALHKLCDERGKMLIVAIDQRNSMRAILGSDKETRAQISNDTLGLIKSDIVKYLGNQASAVLLDPVCALPEVIDEWIIARDVALVVGIDKSGWEKDKTTPLRRSRIIDGMSPSAIRKLGGSAAKLLVYMRPDWKDGDKYALTLISDTIEEYAKEELLLVIEILPYRLPGENEKEYEVRKPELIIEAAKSAAEVGAKVLKLPFPGSAEACAKVSEVTNNALWSLLSAGVDHNEFKRQLKISLKGGATGAIVGRALWKDCISLDHDITRARLEKVAVPRLNELKNILKTI